MRGEVWVKEKGQWHYLQVVDDKYYEDGGLVPAYDLSERIKNAEEWEDGMTVRRRHGI